eukprot:4918380-Pyramimonas_sp.AAC.1
MGRPSPRAGGAACLRTSSLQDLAAPLRRGLPLAPIGTVSWASEGQALSGSACIACAAFGFPPRTVSVSGPPRFR